MNYDSDSTLFSNKDSWKIKKINNCNSSAIKGKLDTVRENEDCLLRKGKTVNNCQCKIKLFSISNDKGNHKYLNESLDNIKVMVLRRVNSFDRRKCKNKENNSNFNSGNINVNVNVNTRLTCEGDSLRKVKVYCNQDNNNIKSSDSITNMFNKYKFIFEDGGNAAMRNSYGKKQRGKRKGGSINKKGSTLNGGE